MARKSNKRFKIGGLSRLVPARDRPRKAVAVARAAGITFRRPGFPQAGLREIADEAALRTANPFAGYRVERLPFDLESIHER